MRNWIGRGESIVDGREIVLDVYRAKVEEKRAKRREARVGGVRKGGAKAARDPGEKPALECPGNAERPDRAKRRRDREAEREALPEERKLGHGRAAGRCGPGTGEESASTVSLRARRPVALSRARASSIPSIAARRSFSR